MFKHSKHDLFNMTLKIGNSIRFLERVALCKSDITLGSLFIFIIPTCRCEDIINIHRKFMIYNSLEKQRMVSSIFTLSPYALITLSSLIFVYFTFVYPINTLLQSIEPRQIDIDLTKTDRYSSIMII